MKVNNKPKIVFISLFTNKIIRNKLKLKSWTIRNFIFKILRHSLFKHSDFAVWVSDFIEQFEKHPIFEYHIISIHIGMRVKRQDFIINNIHYHFLKLDHNLIIDFLVAKFFRKQHDIYIRKRVNNVIKEINPDLVVLCGAENPCYSSVALDINDYPIYLLLQTVLNNPQLISYNVGSPYRREMEKKIFQKILYFGTSGYKYYSLYKSINSNAVCLSTKFPSHKPLIQENTTKEYDFLFYGQLSKNKGVEDLIKAMSNVVDSYPNATLCIIGEPNGEYGSHLQELVVKSNCASNIVFLPRFSSIDDLHATVQKGRCVVLPSITGFNSTIRESMLMNLPVIVYETEYIKNNINVEKECLLSAKINDIDDLYKKMLFAIENPTIMFDIAKNGKEYAEREFDNDIIGNNLIENFHAIIANYKYNTPIPNKLRFKDTQNQLK